MSKLVSQSEIQKFKDNEEVVFPVGSVITPSARDWALEHGITISFGVVDTEKKEKNDFLKNTIYTVSKEFEQQGVKPGADTLARAVCYCLERAGCRIDK